MVVDKCTLPPAGWSCSRPRGHEGPCAASPAVKRYDGNFIDEDWEKKIRSTWEALDNGKKVTRSGIQPTLLDYFLADIRKVISERERAARRGGYKWPDHKGSLHITHNPHRNNYETIEDYCEFRKADDDDWATPTSRQRAIETDNLWEVQWYPNTPVGFNVRYGVSLEEILDSIKENSDPS